MKHYLTRLFLLLCLILILCTALQAQNLTIRLDPAQVTIEDTETCSLDLVIENVNNLGAFQLDIAYNTDVVIVNTALLGTFLGSSGRTVIPTNPVIDNTINPGKLTFGAATFGTTSGPDGNGVLATIVFQAQAAGTTTIELQNLQVSDINGQLLTINSINNGQIVVSSEEPVSEWKEQNSGVSFILQSVKAVSKTVAWVTGADANYGYILRTTDGGENWTNVWNGPNTVKILHVDALDHNNAFVTGYTGGDNNIAFIYKTTNGGSSWTKVYELSGSWVNHVKMFDNQNGIALGDPYNGSWLILKTTDEGNSWQPISNTPMATEGAWSSNLCVYWLDDLKGFFGTNTPNFYYTLDGGLNWSESSVNFLQRTYAVAFNQSNYGVAYDYDGPMARTENAGLSWDEMSPPGVGRIRHITYSENAFWISQGTSIYKSINNGSTWEIQASAESNLMFISFITNQAGTFGWAVGNNGVILKYSNPATKILENVEEKIPNTYQLHQNYPNPFNPETKIQYQISEKSQVVLKVFSILGEEIITLVEEEKNAGVYIVDWNGKNRFGYKMPGGVYLYQIQAGNLVKCRKMILLK